MRRPALLLPALAAACGRADVRFPPEGIDRIVLSSRAGEVEVATREDAPIRIRARGLSRDGLAIERRGASLRVANARDEDKVHVALEVVAPPGLELVATLGQGDIAVRGSYRAVTLKAVDGDISVDGGHVDEGTVTVDKGRLDLALRRPPAGELRCRVGTGRLSMEIPASFRGSINLRSEVGKIDVVEHPKLKLRGDASATSVLAWAGAPYTDDEKAALGTVVRTPAVWAHAVEGRVRFRLVDPGSE